MKSTVYGAKQMPLKLFGDVKCAIVISPLRPHFVHWVKQKTFLLLRITVSLNKQTFRSVQDVFAIRIYYIPYPVSAVAYHVCG